MTVASEEIYADMFFWQRLDPTATWSCQFYQLIQPQILLPTLRVYQQSVIRLSSADRITFYAPKVLRTTMEPLLVLVMFCVVRRWLWLWWILNFWSGWIASKGNAISD